MKIHETEYFHGRKSKPFSIFSIDYYDNLIASGSINGEMKIYCLRQVKTYNDHSGSVLCVRFNKKDFLATCGDDKNVVIYKKDTRGTYNLYKKLQNHESDVSCVLWTSNALISCGYDGQIFVYSLSDYSIVKRIKNENLWRGMSIDAQQKMILCQSDNEIIILNQNYEIIKSIREPFQGRINEVFFARSSWSPNGKYVAFGLAHNNKNNSVEIYEKNTYKRSFSLIGHVAPCEVVAFYPYMLENDGMIVALGSQDKSISLWYNKNPRPFLLIKNIFEQPILDMFWKDNDLYACSYDGTIKILQFEKNEFGVLAEGFVVIDNDKFEIPFSKTNIDINRSGIELGFEQSMFKSLTEDEYKNLVDSLYFDNKSISNKKDISYGCAVKSSSKDDDKKTCSDYAIKTKDSTSESIAKDHIMLCQKSNITDEPKTNNNRTIKKRIQPVLIESLEETKTAYFDKQNKQYAIFKPTKVRKIDDKIEKIESTYETKIENFTVRIENTAKSVVAVFCGSKELYKLYYDFITLFTCNNKYMCLVIKDKQADSLVVLQIESGVLVIPIITYFYIVQISISSHLLLILSGDSFFQVLDIKKQIEKSSGYLPSTDHLINIKLDKKYYIIAQYKDAVYFYDKKMKVWYKKSHNYNTIFFDKNSQTIFDESSEHDDTICKLEYKFKVYEKVFDSEKMIKIAHKMVKLCLKMTIFDDYSASKIHTILNTLYKHNQKRVVIKFLEEMNVVTILQPFVLQMMKLFDEKLKQKK